MIGGRGARHRENTELVSVRLDDPGHPLTEVFGGPFGYRDEFFREMHALGLRPKVFGVEYSRNWLESLPQVRECVEFFHKTALKLAR